MTVLNLPVFCTGMQIKKHWERMHRARRASDETTKIIRRASDKKPATSVA